MQIFSFFYQCAMHFSPAIANSTDYREQARTASDKKQSPESRAIRLARDLFRSCKKRQNQAKGCTVTSLLIFEIKP